MAGPRLTPQRARRPGGRGRPGGPRGGRPGKPAGKPAPKPAPTSGQTKGKDKPSGPPAITADEGLGELLFGEQESDPQRNVVQDDAAQKSAAAAIAKAQTGREAAQGGVAGSLEGNLSNADRFRELGLDFDAGGAEDIEKRQLQRLLQRAQGIGVSPGEQALNRAISAGTAQQQSLVGGAAPGDLITAQRQGQRATSRGTRDINRNRELVQLQDQFSAQDQLAQALGIQRGQAQDRAGQAGELGVDLGNLAGAGFGGAFDTSIGREQGLTDIQIGDIVGQQRSDVSLAALLGTEEPDEGLFGKVADFASGALAAGKGGFG
ncbi:MAG: hypothetical protein O7B23_10770 [Deltaproteobacteria bacterium]|nr:hypothetical protein [Deltaproteobacteria bacterium]